MQLEIKEFVIYSSPSFLPVHTYTQPSCINTFSKWCLRRSVPLHYVNIL